MLFILHLPTIVTADNMTLEVAEYAVFMREQ
jgi:hypothetical protein